MSQSGEDRRDVTQPAPRDGSAAPIESEVGPGGGAGYGRGGDPGADAPLEEPAQRSSFREGFGWSGEGSDGGERAGDDLVRVTGEADPARGSLLESDDPGEDARLRQEVRDRLQRAPGLDASGIEVSTSSGAVTLSGVVADVRAQETAEACAAAARGVHSVYNDLDVRSKESQQTTGSFDRPGVRPS